MKIPPRPNLPTRERKTPKRQPPVAVVEEPRPTPEPDDEIDIIPMRTDVCVFGGTAAGVIAAASLSKAGYPVLLVEPGRHLGGLVSGGVCEANITSQTKLSGLLLDLLSRIGRVYGTGPAAAWEPCVAEAVFNDMARDFNLTTLFCHRLVDVKKTETKITELIVERAMTDDFNAPAPAEFDDERTAIAAKVYIDCSYEGDLMNAAGVQASRLPTQLSFDACLTTNASNRRAVELIHKDREVEANLVKLGSFPATFATLPNGKAQLKLDPAMLEQIFTGGDGYLTADTATRGRIWRESINRLAAALNFLANDSRTPEATRKEFSQWSLCGDEFLDTAGWPHQAHILGGRRLDPVTPAKPYPLALDVAGEGVPVEMILPHPSECENLIVPVCSASTRTDEITRIAIAESAASLAALACEDEVAVHAVPYSDLLATLRSQGVRI